MKTETSAASVFVGLRESLLPPKTFFGVHETAFLAYYANRFWAIRQGGIFLFLLGWAIFLGLDLVLWQIDPNFAESGTKLVLLRLAILPALLAFVMVGRSTLFGSDERFANRVVLSMGLLTILHEILMLMVAPFPYDFLHYFEGVMALLLFGFGIFRLAARDVFRFLVVASIMLLLAIWSRWVVSYSTSLMAYVAYAWIGFGSLLVVIIVVGGSLIGIQLESGERRSYFDQHLLRENNLLLEQQQLETREARHRAEAATRSKSEFLANMSHEIRTPMNAIIGFCTLILRTELSAAQRDYLNKAQGATRLLMGVINQVLDFSKIEEGQMTLEAIPFELDGVLQSYVAVLGEAAAAKALELSIDVDANVPHRLVGDPLRLAQILINYGNNAIKFTCQGRVHLHISLLGESEGHVDLLVEVLDSGIGLSPEQISRLFHSFSQADGAVTRKYGGTGLGLAISKKLAELMGGEVGVESTLNEGARFWFTAHLARYQETDDSNSLVVEKLRGARALVVDDRPDAALALQRLLSQLGFIVDKVDSGEAALVMLTDAAAAGGGYDLMLVEWRMQNMDGVATINGMRRLSMPLPPRCILMCNHGDSGVQAVAKQFSIEEVLIKPVIRSTLMDTVIRLFELDTGMQSHPVPAESPLSHEQQAQLKGIRLLLVEDNVFSRQVMNELLTMAGISVTTAQNGEEALKAVSSASFDLILMDMQLPGMDGMAATAEIHRLQPGSAPPIIGVSANVMASDREQCLKAGMCDFVIKPIDFNQLLRTMLRWIEAEQSLIG